MDNEWNNSYVTLSGFVEITKYRYLYFTIMFILYVLIICSNSTIVYIIWTNKSLHEPMYIFIAALLFNCVLYGTIIYPKLLIDFLSEKQTILYSACLFQFCVGYSVGGAEFFLLAAMAFDRYVSICKPLRHSTIMTKTTVNLFLVLAWIIPAFHPTLETVLSAKTQLCSFNLKGIICNNSVFTLQCVKSRLITIIGLVSLIYVVILPFLFTIFTYTMILIVSFEKGKTYRRKAAETCIPHLLVLINLSCSTVYNVIIARVDVEFSQLVQFIMTLQVFLYQSLLNPIIYGLKMKEISKRLKHLFLNKV